MTRINLVNPEQLTNEHLQGEYKELPRIFTLVSKAVEKGKTPSDYEIPEVYVLGSGHVTFFYDKLSFLMGRYQRIRYEMKRRGRNINDEMFISIRASYNAIPSEWKGEYSPTPDEIYLNMARICKRSKLDNVINEMLDM